MLDAAFLVAELAAILGGIMRAVTRSDEVVGRLARRHHAAVRRWGTIGFNVGPRLPARRPRRPPDHLALCGGLAPGPDDPVRSRS